ncbi:MAG: DUF368 domain-containing protein [Bacilli bacterium]
MKKRLKEILYGFLFGISCLIPGFSGGTMLLILGIYENFTASLAKLSKKPIEAFIEALVIWNWYNNRSCSRKIGNSDVLNYFPVNYCRSFFCWISNCNDSNYF